MEDRIVPASFLEFVDPNPLTGNQFGADVVVLSTGNVVITSPFDDAGGTDAGAVYLFDGDTGGLISTLTGTQADDHVGSGGVVDLGNGNFVVISPDWDNGSTADAGAVTFGDGTTGVSGIVSDANSLVGSTADDQVGSGGVTALGNGNYVVVSKFWDDASATANVGAVTFGNGTTGVSGAVTDTNSLVGGAAEDQIGGNGVTALGNGNYVVVSTSWDDASATANVGAVTFGDGTTGVSGVVTDTNSLVGSSAGDRVGNRGVTVLANNNYVVTSINWKNGSFNNAGAVTFGDGTTGVSGVVDGNNSLIGAVASDRIGFDGIFALANGNYLVASAAWHSGGMTNVGAVTFGDGTTGVSGVVDATNSLVGDDGGDFIGSRGIKLLSNGNYVITSSDWGNARGAVTWGDGDSGVVGVIDATNSLVGATPNVDGVGNFLPVLELTNGNYVVTSPNWNGGVGAVTWADGTTGIVGTIDATNSLIGNAAGDFIGLDGVTGVNAVFALSNGNYAVSSFFWNGARGAVTLGDGVNGTVGVVDATNSLVGTNPGDAVGLGSATESGISPLTNGNFVVFSPFWNGGLGAVTLVDGTNGLIDEVDAGNSLVGSTASDLETASVVALDNGNYLVVAPGWDNSGVSNAGAVTFADGTSGVVGVIDMNNSLVGSTASDQVGLDGVTLLANGNYVIVSSAWNGNMGAVSFGDAASGVTGLLGAGNSLLGGAAGDLIGSGGIALLQNGNYIVISSTWNSNTGAVTFGDGTTGVSGVVDAGNSLVGGAADDQVGSGGVTILDNDNYLVNSPLWDSLSNADAGALTFGSGTNGVSGVIDTGNSTIGEAASTNLLPEAVLDDVNGNYFGRFLDEVGGRVRVGSQENGSVLDIVTTLTVALTVGNNPSAAGEALTFTATVSSSGNGSPTGTVQFFDGATLLGDGTAVTAAGADSATSTFTIASLDVAGSPHNIRAVFTGAGGFEDSEGNLSHTVEDAGPPEPPPDEPKTLAEALAANNGFTIVGATGSPTQILSVKIFDSTGNLVSTLTPFDHLTSLRVAAGDFDGDGLVDEFAVLGRRSNSDLRAEIVTYDLDAAGNASETARFFAFDPGILGNGFIAAGDFDGDGDDDIVVAQIGGGRTVVTLQIHASAGGSFSMNGSAVIDFGVVSAPRVGSGDTDGDGFDEIVVAARTQQGARVLVFDADSLAPIQQGAGFTWAFGIDGYRRGAFVAVGEFDANLAGAEIVLGSNVGGNGLVDIVHYDGVGSATLSDRLVPFGPDYDAAIRVTVGQLDDRVVLIAGQDRFQAGQYTISGRDVASGGTNPQFVSTPPVNALGFDDGLAPANPSGSQVLGPFVAFANTTPLDAFLNSLLAPTVPGLESLAGDRIDLDLVLATIEGEEDDPVAS